MKKEDYMLSKSDLWEREWGSCSMIEGKMYIQIFFSFLVLAFCYIAPLYWISCQLPQILCGCKVKITIMRTPSLLISLLWLCRTLERRGSYGSGLLGLSLSSWGPLWLFLFLATSGRSSTPRGKKELFPGRCFSSSPLPTLLNIFWVTFCKD